MIQGYLRRDGRKGIRDLVAVVYLVECAHHVAREIAAPARARGVHLIGFPGCYPNDYAERMLRQLCCHPNVGAVLLVSLGCESFDRAGLEREVAESGRPVATLVVRERGGTLATVEAGRRWVESALERLRATTRA
ncbi:MAG: UxaA family hydrolase, partial [Planctomycetes bacterium]|nr:UxaA family hydrolase [Planctomycetota bacterium]